MVTKAEKGFRTDFRLLRSSHSSGHLGLRRQSPMLQSDGPGGSSHPLSHVETRDGICSNASHAARGIHSMDVTVTPAVSAPLWKARWRPAGQQCHCYNLQLFQCIRESIISQLWYSNSKNVGELVPRFTTGCASILQSPGEMWSRHFLTCGYTQVFITCEGWKHEILG